MECDKTAGVCVSKDTFAQSVLLGSAGATPCLPEPLSCLPQSKELSAHVVLFAPGLNLDLLGANSGSAINPPFGLYGIFRSNFCPAPDPFPLYALWMS